MMLLMDEEHIEGIGGRKPARHFYFCERGSVKHQFHHSKILWVMISGLTPQGYIVNFAITAI
jgi:hypothetical protein